MPLSQTLVHALLVHLLLLSGMLGSASAAELPPPRAPEFSDRPLAVEVRTGLATSVGLLGAVVELTPINWVTVGGGIGNNGYGSILGAHVRLRPIVFASPGHANLAALTIETAYSRGRHGGFDFGGLLDSLCEGSPQDPSSSCYRPGLVPQVIDWGQVEVGGEVRLGWGLTLRSAMGVAAALHWPEWQCTNKGLPASCLDHGRSEPDRTLFVLTTAVGYAF